jgi:hypothetical protein
MILLAAISGATGYEWSYANDHVAGTKHRSQEQDMKRGIAVVLAAAANTVVGQFQTRTAVFACSN